MKRLLLSSLLLIGLLAAIWGWRSARHEPITVEGTGPSASSDLDSSGKGAPLLRPLAAETAAQPASLPVPLVGTAVSLRQAGAAAVELTGSGGLFDRVLIQEKLPVTLSVKLGQLRPGAEVSITAPNGGQLRRPDGRPLKFDPSPDQDAVELEFEPTLGRGAYTIRVQQAGESQIIDLWAGDLPQRGEPGPSYTASEFSKEVP